MNKRKNVLLSVVIPNYNNAEHIKRCMDSIINSESTEIEIIVVDDGSSDSSWEILGKYIHDKRVSIVKQKNQGTSSARNTGIQLSHGKYLIFCDSDDYYHNLGIDKVISFIKSNELSSKFTVFNASKCIEKENIIVKYEHNIGEMLIESKNGIIKVLDIICGSGKLNTPWNKIYDLETIKKYDLCFPIGIARGEDAIFNLNYAMKCNGVRYLEEFVYVYSYGVSGYTSGNTVLDIAMCDELIERIDIMKKIIKNSECLKKREKERLCSLTKNIFIDYLIIYVQRYSKEKKYGYNEIVDKLNHQEMQIVLKTKIYKFKGYKRFLKILYLRGFIWNELFYTRG